MTFNNRTAVITGAAGRIGRGTAREFARHVVVPYQFFGLPQKQLN